MGSQEFWDNLWGNVWNPVRWVQIVLLALTAPMWLPIVRGLLQELREVLAPEGGVYGTQTPRPIRPPAPGEDPFAKVPLPRRRGPLGPAPRGNAGHAVRSTAAAPAPRGFRSPR